MTPNKQESINERIKFLIEKLGMSVRGFSTALGVSDTNTRNYIDRGSKPNSDYIEKLLRHFSDINPAWLLLGEGQPFLIDKSEPRANNQTGNSGNVIGNNNAAATQSITRGSTASTINCEQQLQAALLLNEQLRSQLLDKERIISLLEKALK